MPPFVAAAFRSLSGTVFHLRRVFMALGMRLPSISLLHAKRTTVHPLQGDQEPEALIKRVHGLPIQLQKRSCLRRCKIQTKALHYFFDPILA